MGCSGSTSVTPTGDKPVLRRSESSDSDEPPGKGTPDSLGVGTPGTSPGFLSPPAHALGRRLSRSEERLQEVGRRREMEGDEDHVSELFKFSDFNIPVKDERRQRRQSSVALMRNPSLRQRRSSKELFEFGDFCIRMDNELDEEIVQHHYAELTNPGEIREVILPPASPIKPKVPLNLFQPTEPRIRNFRSYTLLGHASRVKCIALAPNENYYVSCSHEEMAVSMHDVRDGKETVSFFGHEDTIIGVAFSADSKLLSTTSRDNSMILWDAITGKQLFIFDHEKVVICCTFSRDSRYLVSGCQDMVCRVWDTKRRRELLAFTEHEGIIVNLGYSPDDTAIVSAAADKTIKVWGARTGIHIRTLSGHTGIVLSCMYSNDGVHVVSNDEKTVKVWEVSTGKCVTTIAVGQLARPFNPKLKSGKKLAWTLSTYCPGSVGFFIVGVANDKVVNVLHPFTGEEILSFYCKAPVYCLDAGRQNKLAFGDAFGNVYIANLW